MEKVIKGFKGLDKNFKCRDFQYEVGKTYTKKGIKICEKGFHFCENPLDVFSYYAPADSRFSEVEGSGKIIKGEDKICCSKLKIKTEIGLNALIGAGVKFILEKVDFKNAPATNTGDYSAATNTGDYSAATNTGNRSVATNTGYQSAATNTGDYSAATNTGNRSVATNTGDYSAASVEGKESIACALGCKSKAKGALGCWLVIAEKDEDFNLIDVKAVKVDGKKIKADTFYTLENGKFVEVE